MLAAELGAGAAEVGAGELGVTAGGATDDELPARPVVTDAVTGGALVTDDAVGAEVDAPPGNVLLPISDVSAPVSLVTLSDEPPTPLVVSPLVSPVPDTSPVKTRSMHV